MNRLPNHTYHLGKQIELFTNENALQEIIIESISDLIDFLSIPNNTYSFRGQSNFDWKLQTSFERFIENKNICIAKHHIEEKILKQYKSECSIYSKELGYDPLIQNQFDSLSDIQHYGGQTRLLDWTSSFNIALFFAIFNNDFFDNASVYCLRNIQFNATKANSALKNLGITTDKSEELDEKKLLHFYIPKRKNPRIIPQNGYFIYPASIDTSFEDALSYMFDDLPLNFINSENSIKDKLLKSTLIKVKIPRSIIPEIQNYLKNAGISAKTLFPDYHGAIQSLYEIRTDIF